MAKKRLRARLGHRGAPSRKERRMILNVSSRTDIVHYYTPWFLERLREGRAIVPNPEVPDHAMELDLSPESVQGIVFCSKDYRPLLPHLARLAGKWPVYCHYTITPYGRDVEPGVPDVRESMATLRELSRITGRERVAWRYDPVLVNGAYPVQRHMRDFTAMAGILAPFISLCVFSFVDLYGKVRRAMPDLMPVSTRDMDTLAAWFGQTAQRLGFTIQTCGSAPDYARFGIGRSGCITAALLGKAWGLCLGRARPGNRRRGCGCMATVDIGTYDTCRAGCLYCYACRRPGGTAPAIQNPASPLLFGSVEAYTVTTRRRDGSRIRQIRLPGLG